MVEMYGTFQGYIIRLRDGDRWLYVGGYRNGRYKWVTDHLYAKKYKSKQTARKHFKKIGFRDYEKEITNG